MFLLFAIIVHTRKEIEKKQNREKSNVNQTLAFETELAKLVGRE
jgi:hypothetical protein